MGHDNTRIYGTHITYTVTPFRQRLFVDLSHKFFKQAKHFMFKNWHFSIALIIPIYVVSYARRRSHEIEKSHWY